MTGLNPESLKMRIREAFAEVRYPGDARLRGSDEGEEPFLLEQEFKGKDDWRNLGADFLDQAPDGFSSALSFFSNEAFRFYLPAYLIADVDGRLEQADPVFHLTHGLDNESKDKLVNPKHYGARVWFDCKKYRFSIFLPQEAEAIRFYLEWKKGVDKFEREPIEQALKNYWNARVGEAEKIDMKRPLKS